MHAFFYLKKTKNKKKQKTNTTLCHFLILLLMGIQRPMTWLLATQLHTTGQKAWDSGTLLKPAACLHIYSDRLFLEYTTEWPHWRQAIVPYLQIHRLTETNSTKWDFALLIMQNYTFFSNVSELLTDHL